MNDVPRQKTVRKESKPATIEENMSQMDSTTPWEHKPQTGSGSTGGMAPSRTEPESGGFLKQYKSEQGKWTRLGTFLGAGALVAWGSKFLFDKLSIYDGFEAWRLLITSGIPLAFAVIVGGFTWWITYAGRRSGDFMIATEGEMKKVNWSSKREIIGSTKVVILFTVLMATYLFVVDLVFQQLFSGIGVLKK